MTDTLSLMIFVPLIGMAVVLCLPSRNHSLIRATAVAFSVPPLILAIALLWGFQREDAGFQFVHHVPWIAAFNIDYFVGIDGISIAMVVLTALLCFLCMIASFGIETGVKGYYALFLLLETGMMGVFCALDFFLFFVFWEMMLLPMYFLIGIWAGRGASTRRSSSSSTRCSARCCCWSRSSISTSPPSRTAST